MFWLVPACTAERGSGDDAAPFSVGLPEGEPETSPEAWSAELLVPAAALEVFVSLDPPLTLYGTELTDLDADGVADLVAVTLDPTDFLNIDVQVVVFGPLDDVVLPADAHVNIPEDAYAERITPIELTGDEAIDVVTWNTYPAIWLRPSPYDGSSPPGPGWVDVSAQIDPGWGTWVIDVDRDGTADRLASRWSEDDERLELTRGPYERFGDPPDVTVTPTCLGAIDDDPYDAAAYNSVPVGDLDGDGSPELAITSYAWAKSPGECGGFTVSLPASGIIDPFSSSLVVGGVAGVGLTHAGDWNGDGRPELWDAASGTLLVSPITLTANGPVATDTRDATSAIETMTPVPVDVDGDGRTEILVSLDRRVLALVPPDLDGIAEVHVETAWDVGLVWPQVYVDRGRVYVAFSEGATMRRIDLGELVVAEPG